MKEKIDWDNTGLLKGLSEEESETVKKYLDNLDFNEIGKMAHHDFVEQYIAPVVIRIVLIVIHQKYKLWSKTDNGVSNKRIIALIDTQEIIDQLHAFGAEFIKIATQWLPYVSIDADMMKLFCDNYVMWLVKKLT